jgi:hypothetical protein
MRRRYASVTPRQSPTDVAHRNAPPGSTEAHLLAREHARPVLSNLRYVYAWEGATWDSAKARALWYIPDETEPPPIAVIMRSCDGEGNAKNLYQSDIMKLSCGVLEP